MAAAQAAPPNDRFKFDPPANFTGRKDGARTWIALMEEWFDMPGVPQLNNQNKVRIILMKLSGDTTDWRASKLRYYNSQGQAWPTWDVFKTDFIGKWGETDEAAKALRKLREYTWETHKKHSLSTIIMTVDTLIQESGIANEGQKKSFL